MKDKKQIIQEGIEVSDKKKKKILKKVRAKNESSSRKFGKSQNKCPCRPLLARAS